MMVSGVQHNDLIFAYTANGHHNSPVNIDLHIMFTHEIMGGGLEELP